MTHVCSRCGLFHPAGTPGLALSVSPSTEQNALAVGTLLAGRYALLHTIHRGGMGVVYLAEDLLRQGHQIVLKELRLPEGVTPEERREAEAWFARESYLLSSLRSPLIPHFYSVFQEDGRSYIVQEYVAGENLDQVVARHGPLHEDLVIGWGVALCELLSYLHEQDEPVIYRDLKPANILWRDGGSGAPAAQYRLAVVDFGIARPFRRGEVGTVIGTPGYAPPEQYQGLATPQSDVYALGATLHRLLTGYDPEHSAPFTFPPLRQLNPQVSPELAAVVERAVRLDPAARFESARTMGASLQELAQQRGRWLAVAAPAQGVQPFAAIRGGWIGLMVGALLLGPMLLPMVGSFLNRAVGGSMSFAPSPPPALQGQLFDQGNANGFGQGWAPAQGGPGIGDPDGRFWARYHVDNDGIWSNSP